jgi:hypothetical protein
MELVMRRSSFLVMGPLLAGCLSPPTVIVDGGVDAVTTTPDTGPSMVACDPDAGLSAAALAANTNDEDSTDTTNIVYMDDLATHPGCTTVGITTRTWFDGTAASYTAAVINGGKFACCAKEYPVPANEDVTKPIIVLVHGNSSTPNDWETYVHDPTNAPMLSEILLADGYHVYASDVRFDKVPVDMTNNPAQNYDHGWAVPIVQSLLTNLFEQYPPPRMFNIAGFSIGPTVIRDALRRMQRAGLSPFARIHALHFASAGNHGVGTWSALCGSQASPVNTTMAGLAACQLGNRTGYTVTPFEQPLNGGNPPDVQSFDTPCSDGTTAFGQTGACGCNKVVYTTAVFKDNADGTTLDEIVDQASTALVGANNMTVTEPEPGTCPAGSTTNCVGYFDYPELEYHFASIRSAQGIAIAKAALETQ